MNRLPVLERTYDLLRWLVPVVATFPRAQRYLLGERIEKAGLDLLELLIEARVSPDTRPKVLLQAGVRADCLLHLLRLAHDLTLISQPRYEHGSRLVDEVARQVAGWLQHSRKRMAPTS